MTTISTILIYSSSSSSSSSASFQTPKPHHKTPKCKKTHPPISISTNPSHLNPHHLQQLFLSSNLSCHRFPSLTSDGKPEAVDIDKLRVAIAHSFVLVSVFCRDRFLSGNVPIEMTSLSFGIGHVFERMLTVPDSDHRLVGFGRVVSDGGLTASIHDVVVMPSLQRLGIGRKIVGRIIRMTDRAVPTGSGWGQGDVIEIDSDTEPILEGAQPPVEAGLANGVPTVATAGAFPFGGQAPVLPPPQLTPVEEAFQQVFQDISTLTWSHVHLENKMDSCEFVNCHHTREVKRLRSVNARPQRRMVILNRSYTAQFEHLERRCTDLQVQIAQLLALLTGQDPPEGASSTD